MTFLKLSIRKIGWDVIAASLLTFGALTLSQVANANEPPIASPWMTEQASRVRAIAGKAAVPGGAGRIYAGLEIELDDGWKTYWRNPGSSGVPPRIDLEGSENLARGEVLFPAPIRFLDRDGDTIGYKRSVVLPLLLEPKDPTKPIILKIAAEYGICRDVCIPVQPNLTLTVPSDGSKVATSEALTHALAKVPRTVSGPTDPRVEQIETTLAGDKPKLVIDVAFPAGVQGADLFLEAPEGRWVPLPKASGVAPSGASRFLVDLSDGADVADLKGRAIRATLVSTGGQSEHTFELVEAR